MLSHSGPGHSHSIFTRPLVSVVACVLIALLAVSSPATAQERKTPQTAGVDNSKMGPYRALAQLAFAASQKGDNAGAATLAKVLERTWDKGEDYGGDTALSKTNHALFESIDKAMDQFVNLLLEHQTAAPDAGKVKSAYTLYLEKLKQAD
jgi:hypothetical protein